MSAKRECRVAWLACWFAAVTVAPLAASDTPAPDYQPSAGPYCGIYSLYAALNAVGIHPRFEQLLDDKYLTSPAGSSLDDLVRAARDFGAHAEALDQLTATSLRSCRTPLILHVRRPGKDTAYAHWVLYLGVENGRARIIDRPGRVEHWTFADLLAYTDGTGLLVSAGPPDTTFLYWSTWFGSLFPLGLVLVGLGFMRWIGRSRSAAPSRSIVGAGRYLATLCGLVVVAVVAGLIWHLSIPEGFLDNRRAIGQVQIRFFPTAIGTVDVRELESLAGRSDVTVIDARLPRAYRAGHVPGAINIPIDSSIGDREAVVASIPHTNFIVVYCQSEECVWGESIATDLVSRGYRRVAVFSGGWVSWNNHARKP